MSALPIFPGSFPPSIFGTNELNYRVRYGNGWTLIVINTDYLHEQLYAAHTLIIYSIQVSLIYTSFS